MLSLPDCRSKLYVFRNQVKTLYLIKKSTTLTCYKDLRDIIITHLTIILYHVDIINQLDIIYIDILNSIIIKGGLHGVEHIVDMNLNLNINRLFSTAASMGNLSIVKYLLGKRVDINCFLGSALRKSFQNNHISVTKYLIEKGADLGVCNNHILIETLRKKDIDFLYYLFEHGVNIYCFEGCTMRFAADRGDLAMIKYLVGRGMSVHIYYSYALRVSLREGYLDIVEYIKTQNMTPSEEENVKRILEDV